MLLIYYLNKQTCFTCVDNLAVDILFKQTNMFDM